MELTLSLIGGLLLLFIIVGLIRWIVHTIFAIIFVVIVIYVLWHYVPFAHQIINHILIITQSAFTHQNIHGVVNNQINSFSNFVSNTVK